MEKITGNIDLDGIKRFQISGTYVKIKCPKCGEIEEIELVDQLYYPAEKFPDGHHVVAFECEKCGIEVGRKLKLISAIATFEVGESEIV